MFSVPFNQSGLYALRHAADYTDLERKAIDDLLDMDTLSDRYLYMTADGVKGYSERGSKGQYFRYILAWACQGVRHPLTYVDAFMALNAGWLSPRPIDVMFQSGRHLEETVKVFIGPVYEHSDFSESSSNALSEIYLRWGSIPLLNIVISSGFYMTFLPVLMLCLLLVRRKPYGLIPDSAFRWIELPGSCEHS